MSDQYLLQAAAKVTGREGLELLDCALNSCHYNRYTFRRCGEQLTRQLADGWESLRATIERAEDVFEGLRLSASLSLQQSLRQEVRHASGLLAEVVALFASCIPTTASSVEDQRRVAAYTIHQQHEAVALFFHEVHHNERSLRLVSEMKAAMHQIDLSLVSASLHETKTFRSTDQGEQRWNETVIRVPKWPASVQFRAGFAVDELHLSHLISPGEVRRGKGPTTSHI